MQPLAWLSFTAALQNGRALLNWSVAMEENNKEFVIERSTDAIHWIKLFVVASRGNTPLQRNYTGIDAAPVKGLGYYRVRQVDIDGRFTYSAITSVKVESDGALFVIYPNPVQHVINYEILQSSNVLDISLQLYSADGNLLKQFQVNNSQGSFSIRDLPVGIYVLRMKDNNTGRTENRKVVIQK